MYDLSAFCFVCFKTNKTLDTISTNDTEFLTNLKEIGYDTDWLIKETPIQLCCDCIYLLNITTNFKELCVKNNETLKSYIEKLKNGAVGKRDVLQVLAKPNRAVVSRRCNGRVKKVQIAPKRKLPPRRLRKNTKIIKPNIVLNFECSVKLKRISVLEEQKKLLNAGKKTLENQIQDGGTTCEVQIKDGDLIACDLEIIDGGIINDDIPSDTEVEDIVQATLNISPTKRAVNIVRTNVDELFPNPEDSCLRNILKSMERSAKQPQPDIPVPSMERSAEQPQPDPPATSMERSAKQPQPDTPAPSMERSAKQPQPDPPATSMERSAKQPQPDTPATSAENSTGRAFITKLKEEFRKTLITYSNTRIGELCSKYESSIDNLNGSEPQPMTSKFTGLRPVPLAKLLPKSQMTLNNNHTSNTYTNNNMQKRKAPPNTTKHSKKQNGPDHNIETQYLNFALTSFANSQHFAPNAHSTITNSEIVSESDSDVEIISETRLTPDYVDVPNEISLNSQQLIDSAVLLNCEVQMDENTECDQLVNCMLCNTVNENPNSNYCEPCFNRLNLNLQQNHSGICINCNKPLANTNASMFCADCNKITVIKSTCENTVANLQTNVFGSLFSQCVMCCKICRNATTGVVKPNILCNDCGIHNKLEELQLINCDLCQYKFVYSVNYDAHVREHLIKAFECPICLKRFSTKRYLLVHAKRHSSYKCTVCDKEFVEIQALRDHRKFHPIIKDAKCSFCGKIFTKRQIKRHLKQVHPNVSVTNVI